MYETEYNEKRYCFFDDHMTINGVSIPYERMTDIVHRSGDAPAFVFTYHDLKHGENRNRDLSAQAEAAQVCLDLIVGHLMREDFSQYLNVFLREEKAQELDSASV